MVVGLGVLVGPREILTCAHVVNLALGRGQLDGDRPDGVEVVVGEQRLAARVEQWTPPPPREGAPGDDIAGLRLDVDAPVPPARLITTVPGIGQEVRVFGYPGKPARPAGSWVNAVVRGEVDGGLVQLDSASAIQVQPGYSGSPVWDTTSGRVIGIIATAGRGTTDSYAVGADRLRLAWPSALDRRQRHTDRGLADLTVLQPAGPRFGGEGSRWAERLHEEVAGLRPDLVVVAGDLTEHGLRSEFEAAFGWLDGLAEAVDLPRDRVVVVPGAHDVNRKACAAYFLRMDAEEREPLAPFWAKWEQYAEAFQRYYQGVPVAFTADEPWSLFAVRDLNVAVAGLNSTMADNHLGDAVPEVGGEQVTRLSRRLAGFRDQGWFRVGVVNRPTPELQDLLVGRHNLHVVLDGRVAPNSYDVVRIDPTGLERRTRLLDDDGRWTSEPHLRREMAWTSAEQTFSPARDRREQPTSAPQPDRFFDRVLEATRVDRPTATVTANRDNRYLRVTQPRPGGGFEQWPVFVVDGAVTIAAVDQCHETHLRFAEQDPQTRSELVHGGPPARAEVVAHGLSLGIRVRSWIDYQGLVDLRAIEEQQRRALAEDRVYPAELYVPQRFRELSRFRTGDEQVDLLDQVARWLSADSARFVMVLGDFGRGKSFLLRQLARELPRRLGGVTPVLIELRSLEKAPSLDTLLIQHLSRAGVEEISAPKLKYMIDSGRVALLFDGFDELELRVGYDNATDYLRVLLQRVDDRAKVVLTSRTQHFRLARDVLNVLGEQVTSMASSRVALLGDFADDQIRDFLTRHYHGDAARAEARFELLGEVRDLLGLSRNPRMLSFIADLDEQRLREVERQEGRISAAELYRELVAVWLLFEADRQRHPTGLRSLDEQERLDVCTTLALRLWSTAAVVIEESDLGAAADTLARLAERGYSRAAAQHAVGSGTLLVHTDDGFGFVHQSVMEWLVANAAADALREEGAVGDIATRAMSALMVDFFCDLAGRDAARAWALTAMREDHQEVRQNASTVLTRLGGSRGLDLSGLDLRHQDLGGLDLRGADLSRADLRWQRLGGVSFAGADLRGTDLRNVRMVGGELTGARLEGGDWRQAALLDVAGVADQPELTAAAVAGRDRADLVLGASGGAEAVALSPDGRFMALSRGSVVELISVHTLEVLRVVRGHPQRIQDVAFSPDGTLIATGHADGVTEVRSLDGTLVTRLSGHTGTVWAVAFSPEGDLVATASDDHTVRLSQLDGSHVRALDLHNGPVWGVAFSPDGTDFATAGADGIAQLWTRGGERRRPFAPAGGPLRDVVYSPDGTFLAIGAHDGTVHIWTASGLVVRMIEAHSEPVWAVAFSPDHRHIASASEDGTARIWTADGALVATLEGHTAGVRDIAYMRDGSRLVTTSSDGTVRLWNADGSRAGILRDRAAGVRNVSYPPAGEGLMTTSYGGRTVLWTRSGTTEVDTPGDSTVDRVVFAPGGNGYAVASHDGKLSLWSEGKALKVLSAHNEGIADLAYSPDGWFLATGSVDQTARIWSANNLFQTFKGHSGTVLSVAFPPDSSRLATASNDRTAIVWRLDGTPAVVLKAHTGPVWKVAYSPDGTLIATASSDRTARIWIADGRPIAILDHDELVRSLAFSPDGAQLATACYDGAVRLWTLDGRLETVLSGHDAPVTAVSFSPDGRYIVSGSNDGTTRVWTAAGAHVATLMSTEKGWAVVTADGAYRTGGDASDLVWWAIGLCRFEVGELDRYYPHIRVADEPVDWLPR
ncbi:MAG: NACHT domain-containing protein [Saccharothrix sp.]|nr:NACHT domain-containing protein [Saccharothrix sp.]